MVGCKKLLVVVFCFLRLSLAGQTYLLRPDRVFDGQSMHLGWQVLVSGDKIIAAGPSLSFAPGTEILDLKGMTVLPGLIEGHSHILLHPYNETSWNDQVLFESEAERILRAQTHLKASLNAGFTTLRDLGTEGAGYSDVGIKQALAKKVFIGPDLICAGRAIVATGSYGPRSAAFIPPQGAEEADGTDLIRVVRDQIGRGADLIKIYADYRWGPFGTAMPTFSVEEIKTMVETASSSGREVVAHATTKEGMRRAILGGVKTIEHGDEGDDSVFKLMQVHGVALCPTLSAGEAVLTYRGWNKAKDSIPERIKHKRQSFQSALVNGVKIVMGGDVGVFSHGDNVREMILMHEYGMSPMSVLQAATSGNAAVFGLKNKGHITPGYLADIIACPGNPLDSLTALKNIKLVIKSGVVVKK